MRDTRGERLRYLARERPFGMKVRDPQTNECGIIVAHGSGEPGDPGPCVKVRFADGTDEWFVADAVESIREGE